MSWFVIKSFASVAVLTALIISLTFVGIWFERFEMVGWTSALVKGALLVMTFVFYNLLCSTRFGRQYLFDFFGVRRRK
jgi:hypothetical protein